MQSWSACLSYFELGLIFQARYLAETGASQKRFQLLNLITFLKNLSIIRHFGLRYNYENDLVVNEPHSPAISAKWVSCVKIKNRLRRHAKCLSGDGSALGT